MNTQEFYRECNSLYVKKKYCDAKTCYIQKLGEIEQSQIDTINKAYLIGLARVMDCIWEDMQGETPSDLNDLCKEHGEYFNRYLQYLDKTEKEQIAPDVPLSIFAQRLQMLLKSPCITCEEERKESRQAMRDCFTALLEKSKGKVDRKKMVDRWLEVMESVRRDVGRKDLVTAIKTLALALLEELGETPQNASFRCAVYKLLADTVYFFPEANQDSSAVYAEVRGYLKEALKNDPGDVFASAMQKNVRQIETTSLQIRGFQHDLGSRFARISEVLGKALETASEGVRPSLDYLNKEMYVLQGLADLSVMSGDRIGRVSWDKGLDGFIDDFLWDAIKYHGWKREDVLSTTGPRTLWRLWPGFLNVTLSNLVRNSLDIYGRRNLPLPEKPCVFDVDYARRRVYCHDFAGGVKIEGDIFEPYVSDKQGITSSRGLGLVQARNAMRVQGYDLYLAEKQPADGAVFVMDFNPKCQQ